jgi:hypothetical protein
MTDQLTWNGRHFEYQIEDGRTLYVNETDWDNRRIEAALGCLSEQFPELSGQELRDKLADGSEESDACFDEAKQDMLDPDEWIDRAVEVDLSGDLLDEGESWNIHHPAWIKVA